MNRHRVRKLAAITTGIAALTFGLAAPALAESTVFGHMSGWGDGHASSSWHDYNTDSTNTHVTFYDSCTKEFTGRIRRNNFGPDTTMGSEWINCTSYDDAVYAGDVPSDDYHFDVQLSSSSCGKFSCSDPKTSGDYREYW